MLLRGLTVGATILFTIGLASAENVVEKAKVCSGCHGENGVPKDKTIPIIWGQEKVYISFELQAMKENPRPNDQMTAVLQDLSEEDMLALADYFAAKSWPDQAQPPAPKADADYFAKIAVKDGMGCPNCHMPTYLGEDRGPPRLAGQSETYLRSTMLDLRSGARKDSTWMWALLKTYSLDDIALMARVLAGI
jgi:cytochrome c553